MSKTALSVNVVFSAMEHRNICNLKQTALLLDRKLRFIFISGSVQLIPSIDR